MNGVGATQELSLRVSVATLVRVLFQNPSGDELMLALERKATLLTVENGRVIEINSQYL
jgi:urease accessory protein UreE